MEHEAQSFDRRAFLLEMGAYDGGDYGVTRFMGQPYRTNPDLAFWTVVH